MTLRWLYSVCTRRHADAATFRLPRDARAASSLSLSFFDRRNSLTQGTPPSEDEGDQAGTKKKKNADGQSQSSHAQRRTRVASFMHP